MGYKLGSDIEVPTSPSNTYSTDDLFHSVGVSSEEMLFTESPEGEFVPIERGQTIVLDRLATIWSCSASFRESLGPLKRHFDRLKAVWSAFVAIPRLPEGSQNPMSNDMLTKLMELDSNTPDGLVHHIFLPIWPMPEAGETVPQPAMPVAAGPVAQPVQPVLSPDIQQSGLQSATQPVPTPPTPLSTADNILPGSQPMSVEPIAQRSLAGGLESPVVEMAIAPQSAADFLDAVTSPPVGPLPEVSSEQIVHSPVQPAVVESEQSAEMCRRPRKARAKTPPKPSERKAEEDRPRSPETPASPPAGSEPSTQRVRVRRKLRWPENPESDNQSE